MEALGGATYKTETEGLRPQFHIVARLAGVIRFRSHWIREYLHIEPGEQTDPNVPSHAPPEGSTTVLGRDFLCAWACGTHFKGVKNWRVRKRDHELCHCPSRQYISYEEHITWTLTKKEEKQLEEQSQAGVLGEYRGPVFDTILTTLTPMELEVN